MTYIVQTSNDFSLSPAYANALEQLNTSISDIPEVIDDAQTANRAGAVLATIAGIQKLINSAHAELKKPFLDAGRALDGIKKTETARLDELKAKINTRIVAYQRAEQEKARKAEEEARRRAAEMEEAARKEQESLAPELQIAHAAATDIAIQKETARIVNEAEVAPIAGMRITKSVEIIHVDLATLVKSRFDLCKIEANVAQIKKEILSGKTIPGVEYRIKETASARAVPVNVASYDY